MSQKFGLITGCGKGIGFSITKKLLIENEDINVLGISRTNNNQVEKLQKDYKDRFFFHQCCLSDNFCW